VQRSLHRLQGLKPLHLCLIIFLLWRQWPEL